MGKRLRNGLRGHPGIVPATVFTAGGYLAGGWLGAAIMGSLCWGAVLGSAYADGRRSAQ